MTKSSGSMRRILTRRDALTALVGAAVLPLVARRAAAAWAPSQPITVVVHWAAGGGTDLVFRGLAEVVNSEKLSPQPWIVVNRAGGAGLNGFKYLLDQSGDPHTLGAITPSVMAAVLQQKGERGLAQGAAGRKPDRRSANSRRA